MVNIMWLLMMPGGIIIAGFTGDIEVVTKSIFNSAEKAVAVTINLMSIMTFWLGMMKIIEKSGFIKIIIFILKPIARFLFPGIPRGHRAMNYVLMNMSANLLGMGNAATPFGIKAMEELQKINPHQDTATPEMCTFLAINTAGLTIIPTTVIALRSATGSSNPSEIVVTTYIAAVCSPGVAIIFDRLFRHYQKWK